ncbi:MAG TPA: antitermination protein NusG [Pirellulaceae bacterium]|nr:antitermination protein NusG [Pirellulaceae bacterium]HMO93082.1 antitermination protein NusG [Pirellulaceae bacterium]HMP69967.1 antitermination protein NusG [Pirellulaceae bacterium]
MPILKKEIDIFPNNLLDNEALLGDIVRTWYAAYTVSRQEKKLMRSLLEWNSPFYGPLMPQRRRAPTGRIYTSFAPVFTSYVFLFSTEDERVKALKTNCITQLHPIEAAAPFLIDLQRIHGLLSTGISLTREAKMVVGSPARIRSGPFAGYEGTVIRRQGKTRFLIWIEFVGQGVSVEIDEGLLVSL